MIVGEGMTQSVGTANKITHALAESNINLKMINQGASEISMMFGISRENADKAVLSTYEYCYHGVCLKIYVLNNNYKKSETSILSQIFILNFCVSAF